jgi:hypothetical protein
MPADGYLRSVLADGVWPIRHRGGARELLGIPEDGARVSFPAAPRVAFVYLRTGGTYSPGGGAAWQVKVVDDPADTWPDERRGARHQHERRSWPEKAARTAAAEPTAPSPAGVPAGRVPPPSGNAPAPSRAAPTGSLPTDHPAAAAPEAEGKPSVVAIPGLTARPRRTSAQPADLPASVPRDALRGPPQPTGSSPAGPAGRQVELAPPPAAHPPGAPPDDPRVATETWSAGTQAWPRAAPDPDLRTPGDLPEVREPGPAGPAPAARAEAARRIAPRPAVEAETAAPPAREPRPTQPLRRVAAPPTQSEEDMPQVPRRRPSQPAAPPGDLVHSPGPSPAPDPPPRVLVQPQSGPAAFWERRHAGRLRSRIPR